MLRSKLNVNEGLKYKLDDTVDSRESLYRACKLFRHEPDTLMILQDAYRRMSMEYSAYPIEDWRQS